MEAENRDKMTFQAHSFRSVYTRFSDTGIWSSLFGPVVKARHLVHSFPTVYEKLSFKLILSTYFGES